MSNPENKSLAPTKAEKATKFAITKSIKNNSAKLIALSSIVAIALGGLNDTLDAVYKVNNIVLSQFTDIPSHKSLDRVYIRASSDLLDEIYGAPIYIKKKRNSHVIKYYRDENYILSSIEEGGAIAAYLVFPEQGFEPHTGEHSGGEELLKHSFSYQEHINKFNINTSRTNTYYIEGNVFGEFRHLYTSVSGFSSFLSESNISSQTKLGTLYDDQIFGNDVTQSLKAVRENLTPNFYGYSILDIDTLEDAILSNTEYKLISKL